MNIKTVLASILIISSTAYAGTIKCLIKTNIAEEQEQVQFQGTAGGHGQGPHFEKENFKGFITTSRGYLIVSMTNLLSSQTSTFHGLTTHGVVGGQLIDGESWIQITCKE